MTKYWRIPNTQYPTWEIDLSQLTDFLDLTGIIKKLKIVKYNYSFVYQEEVIKYGISADKSLTWGERIYRQAGHLNGWNRKLAPGSSGSDMQDISDEYFTIRGTHLNRTGMSIVVVDMSDVVSPMISDPSYPLKKLERDQIKEHIERTGRTPIGNKKTEEYLDRKEFVKRDLWETLFEEK
jgi:hypothetical protein